MELKTVRPANKWALNVALYSNFKAVLQLFKKKNWQLKTSLKNIKKYFKMLKFIIHLLHKKFKIK